MKPIFRFETLLQLRRRERDEAGVAVGQANQAIAKVQEQIAQIDQERSTLQLHTSQQVRSGEVVLDRLLQGGRYDLVLQADRGALQETVAKLQQALQSRQNHLKECQVEVRKLEKLRERAYQEHTEAEAKAEQAAIDEVASRGSIPVANRASVPNLVRGSLGFRYE